MFFNLKHKLIHQNAFAQICYYRHAFLLPLVCLPTSAQPLYPSVARYAFDETSAHLINNQTRYIFVRLVSNCRCHSNGISFGKQFRPICRPISPKLQTNFARFGLHFGMFGFTSNRSLDRICLDFLLPVCFPSALVCLPISALPFHLDVARYAFDETAAHLLNNRTKPFEGSND